MREGVPVCDDPGAIPHSRARDGRVWRAPVDAPSAPAAPLARQGAAATALHVDDPELVRVRGLLLALRPDFVDPWEPPVVFVPAVAAGASPDAVRAETIRSDPALRWGDVPRSLGHHAPADPGVAATHRELFNELAALPPDARAVLVWCREHATLGAAGLRGLYADAGVAFASDAQAAAWVDLGARREGAPAWGRRLVLRAAEAWGR